MARTTNYSVLKKYLPKEQFDENYALISHYIQLQGTEKAEKYEKEIIAKNIDLSLLPRKNDFNKALEIPYTNKGEKFSFIDLFAGIGGFRMALQNCGGECVFSSEWDESAKQTYFANYGEVPFGDITKINVEDIPDFDVLAGGFPCQPFSSIGKREGFKHKTQGTLFFYIAEIIKAKQPKAFILENVTGLLTHDEGRTYETIMDVLQNELNYNVKAQVLNSANFGVPQERKRLYFIGFRKDVYSSEIKFPDGNEKKVGIGQFVEKDAKGPSISKHLQQTYIFKKDDGHPEIIDSNSDFPVKTLCASYHKIQRITGTFVRGGETGLRLLTENECKAIMGYPRDFKIPVSRTQMYHQFGNSVAVPVVEKLAEEIVSNL
ncbi:MAG: DNA (cytosine-5-)-methyltransferase [Treponema sp.]|nr:DNA (cytosine-5-)-methyltransferase [Treponema sp.]